MTIEQAKKEIATTKSWMRKKDLIKFVKNYARKQRRKNGK